MRSARLPALLLAGASVLVPARAPAASCTARATLEVGLVIDRSGSMTSERLAAARDAAAVLLGTLGSADQSGLVTYSDYPSVDVPLSPDHARTRAGLDGLVAGGLTATGAAIDASRADIVANGRRGSHAAMIVLTDGTTNAGPSAATAAQAARASGIEMFAVGFGSAVDPVELAEIASWPTETHALRAATRAELLDAFASIARAIGGLSVFAESYAVRVEVIAAGAARADVHKVNQQIMPPGGAGSVSRVTLPAGPLVVTVGTADGSAGGGAVDRATSARASARLADVSITDAAGAALVAADLLASESFSSAGAAGAATGDGDTRFAGLSIAGQAAGADVPPNTIVPIGDAGRLVLNEQTQELGTGTAFLSVNSIHLMIAHAGQTIDVIVGAAWSAAACGGSPTWSAAARDVGDPVTAHADPTLVREACRRVFSQPVCDAIPDPGTLPDIDKTCRQVLAKEVCDALPHS